MSCLVSRTAHLPSTLSWFFPLVFSLERELPSWSELQSCSFCFWKHSPPLLPSFWPYFSLWYLSCPSSWLQHFPSHLGFYIRLYMGFGKKPCFLLFSPQHKMSVLAFILWCLWMLLAHHPHTASPLSFSTILEVFSIHVKSDHTIKAGKEKPQGEGSKTCGVCILPCTEVSLEISSSCPYFISTKFCKLQLGLLFKAALLLSLTRQNSMK